VRADPAREKIPGVDSLEATDGQARRGDELAEITNGIVRLFSDYYGRGPTRAKSYLLENRYVVTIVRDTLTAVERTLAEKGEIDLVRRVRLTFQEAMAPSFKGVVEQALGRPVAAYHSQILVEPDVGFEFFLLEE
jgi:uncharacterized protein YbcI